MAAAKLTPPQIAALNRLLDEVLDVAPGERPTWLDRLPDPDPVVKATLADILARTTQIEAANFLGTPPGVLLPLEALRVADVALAPGELIGPYRLVRELGHGGMGSVWLAERADGLVRRPVALKLPHGAWPRSQLAERLRRERNILAGLEHPNIARLHDAGLTASGQPWLALEYVEGLPIDAYGRGREGQPPLAVAERVRLVLQVAQAVAYAHGKLILHRDLKPQNILVTPGGTVHLLDFGIAKLLTDGETRETQLTQFSGRALSPDYASPEQIRGEALGVTSDIYSLGVVLFELLAGARPYRLTRNSRGELEEAILHSEPRRPSDVAPEGDRTTLRGDLDTIVLRALKKAPAERYPTAHALIDDLERALDGRPVLARADTLRYRTGKFVRRHRVAVATTAVLAVTLIAGVVGTTIGMIRARRAEAAARTEAATAERYSKFLVEMFEVATPGESRGPDITAREILQKGTARIRRDLAGDPRLEARLLTTIGGVNTRLGLYAESRQALDEAVTLLRGQGVDSAPDLAMALARRGEVERYLNEPDKAGPDDREALALFERAYGPNDARLVPALSELALLLRVSDPEQSLRLVSRARGLRIAAYGAADGDAAVLLHNIAGIHLRAHRYQAAKQAYEDALPLLIRRFGEKDPHVGAALSNLADLYRNLGDYRRADEMARHCLAVDTAVSGADHPDVGVDWLQLARISDKLGDARLATEQIDRAIAIFRQLTENHPLRLQAANFKAGFLIEQGRLGDARDALAEFAETKPAGVETKRNLLQRMLVLAEIERLDRRWAESQALAERVLAEPDIAGDRFLEADARWAHAYALAMQSKSALAEAERGRALAIVAAEEGAPFAGVAAHAKYFACAGDPARALHILEDAVAKGFHDPAVLHDPAFAALRKTTGFAPIAAALASPPKPGAVPAK